MWVFSFPPARLFSPCTIIDFPENFPLARLFRPDVFKKFPTCTFILPCTSIRHTRVLRICSLFKRSLSNNLADQWAIIKSQLLIFVLNIKIYIHSNVYHSESFWSTCTAKMASNIHKTNPLMPRPSAGPNKIFWAGPNFLC